MRRHEREKTRFGHAIELTCALFEPNKTNRAIVYTVPIRQLEVLSVLGLLRSCVMCELTDWL